MRKGKGNFEEERKELRESNRFLQFRLHFFEERNGERGTYFNAAIYWSRHRSEFDVNRREAAR